MQYRCSDNIRYSTLPAEISTRCVLSSYIEYRYKLNVMLPVSFSGLLERWDFGFPVLKAGHPGVLNINFYVDL